MLRAAGAAGVPAGAFDWLRARSRPVFVGVTRGRSDGRAFGCVFVSLNNHSQRSVVQPLLLCSDSCWPLAGRANAASASAVVIIVTCDSLPIDPPSLGNAALRSRPPHRSSDAECARAAWMSRLVPVDPIQRLARSTPIM